MVMKCLELSLSKTSTIRHSQFYVVMFVGTTLNFKELCIYMINHQCPQDNCPLEIKL